MKGHMMFTKKDREPTRLQEVIDNLLLEMENHPKDSEAYSKMADQVAKLYKLQEIDSKPRVSPDALVAAAASIAGILLVLYYEQGNVITSRAIQFIRSVR